MSFARHIPDRTLDGGVAERPVRVRYLHGRPAPHSLHRRFAAAIGADPEFIDFRMRWHDQQRSRLYRVASGLVCAATLPHRRQHEVFLVDGVEFWPVLMKQVFLRRDQKLVLHLASHTPYFLLTHRFTPPVERLHLWALRNYDAIICMSEMTVEMVHELLRDRCPPTYQVFAGTPTARSRHLRELKPDLASRRIVFLGTGPVEFRMHYKGLDLMVEAVSIAAASDPEIEFDILGEWDADLVEALMAHVPPATRGRIHFRGQADEISDWFERSALYLHCARGEAFGVSVLEAMTAGLVPLVSEWTGAREAVSQVSSRLVAPLNATEIAKRISWYFSLDPEARRALSGKGRAAASQYTEQAAAAHYQATFATMCEDLAVADQSPTT